MRFAGRTVSAGRPAPRHAPSPILPAQIDGGRVPVAADTARPYRAATLLNPTAMSAGRSRVV